MKNSILYWFEIHKKKMLSKNVSSIYIIECKFVFSRIIYWSILQVIPSGMKLSQIPERKLQAFLPI